MLLMFAVSTPSLCQQRNAQILKSLSLSLVCQSPPSVVTLDPKVGPMIPQHTGLSMVEPCSHPGAPNFSDSFRGDVGILVSQEAPGAHPAASTHHASK